MPIVAITVAIAALPVVALLLAFATRMESRLLGGDQAERVNPRS